MTTYYRISRRSKDKYVFCTYFEIPDKIPDRVKRISNQPLKQGGNSLLNSETYPYFNNL